jgi:hypothetical protein
MSFADPMRHAYYECGVLIQQCHRCGWAQRGHIVELVVCPDCCAILEAPLALEFGGMRMVYTGKGFALENRVGDPSSRMYEADLASLVPFICKHAPDYRRFRPPTHVHKQRIEPVLGHHGRRSS